MFWPCPFAIAKTLANCSKRLRGEAREDRLAEAYSACTLRRNRSSATKHMSLFQQLAKLRRGHEPFVHPLAQICAEPLARQLSTQPALLARFVDQSPCGGELNADAGIALVIDNFLVILSSWMTSCQDLTQLADFVPPELTPFDEVEQLPLLVGDRGFLVIQHDEVTANHCGCIRFSAAVHTVRIGNSRHELPGLQPVAVEHGLARISGAHDDVRASHHSFRITHGLNLHVQELCHLLGKSISMFFRHAINFHLVYGTYRTDGFQVTARLITGAKDPHNFGVLLRQSSVRDAGGRADPYCGKAKVMDKRQGFAGLQAEKENEPPAALQWRGKIHSLCPGHHPLLHDGRIVA